MQYVIQHYLPYILASTCWQWGSSSGRTRTHTRAEEEKEVE